MLRGEPPIETGAPAGQFPRPFGSKYVLLEHLATGGMADVFLARQSGPAGFVKECVIKRILPHLARDQQFIQMFLDEARLCARLNHANIAQVYDLGRVGDDYFIAMEHVHGVDLERVLEKALADGEGRLPLGLAARIVASVADGLEHAHNAVDANGRPLGLVHRDVTPSNIVISFDGVPKLLDFGIAKATAGKGRTESGVIKGKAPYMSPEQVQGQPLDGRSDLFSLGAILFEVTTGVKPFAGDNAAQVGIKILHDDPTPPSLLVQGYPDPLEAIVMGALAKRVDDRVATARGLQVQLEKFLVSRGEHVSAHDVATYLAERFPKERVRLKLLTGGGSATSVEKARSKSQPRGDQEMSERPHRPTGPMSIGDPSAVLGELPGEGVPQHRRNLGGGGGGRWIAVVIVALVAMTGLALYLLRGYEEKKEAQAAPAARATGDAPPSANPPAPTTNPPPPGEPAKAAVAPVEEKKPAAPVEEKKPAAPVEEKKPAAPPPTQPVVTPLPTPAPAEEKTAAKPKKPGGSSHHEHHESGHHSGGLPSLPSPPPTTDE